MERTMAKINTTILDNMIVGRVEPHIYAFSTETVPNYLKVGDTSRGVRVRLEEWRRIFPNLIPQYEHSAQIDDETIFRDFAVHSFLEQEKGRTRLRPDTFDHLPYYSKEFFEDATTEDLDEAIADIHQSAYEKNGKYQFYSPDRLPQILTYERTESYPPRDNQQLAINNFKKAVNTGRTNLLLYAVMRFGKSFTSMCCAKEINAQFVVIVSAKADVKEEWKKTVESHVDFAGYKYLDSESLKRSNTVVADILATGEKVALFLTLQDLQGDNIKEKHKEVFDRQIDLLIIDETHFGARGESYGKVLQEQRLSKSEIKKELKGLDGFETLDRVEDAVKALNAKIRLHLSGTPYRILMSDEFQKEDIIAFVQFTDIIDAQQQWNDEHLKEDDRNEWDNPYYGFPQMIRFAFNPNESSRKKMEQMRKEGITYAFSELFRPLSMSCQTDGSHRQFNHEAEILDLLEVIDGTKEDENLLGFLDYDKIKDGKMCRHIVCVLPFRASCDAMAALVQKNRDRFKNLCDYEIINIAGFDDERKYKSTDDVKRAIKEFEAQNKKTLTLTVNRMLTGTTVPQWDTMLYLKGTSSPQEYDQAIFRLQNQYITTFKDESGKTIKYNMKPQTLLVDFDPNRLFILQELKSQFYNVNTEVQGNALLKERIAKELEVSPIIVLNKNKLQEATPTNITDAVREYSQTRSILDEASEIPADGMLLKDTDILKVIRDIAPIDAKNGLQIKPTEGEGDDMDAPDNERNNQKEENGNSTTDPKQPAEQPVEDDKLEKRLAAYYARVLFFAFLTESTVKSLKDVIEQIPMTEDNQRIAKNLGLNVDILKLIQCKSNPFVLRKFDYKIENTNDLERDDNLEPIKRVEVAMRKFGRLSDSEVVTPAKVADEMVSILPFDELNTKEDANFLDIASKQGEFTIAFYKKFGDKAKEHIYAIPTSALTYEFTRKTYKLLEMPVENVFADFTSYDLIGNDNEKIIKKLTDMTFDVIIGNPPYQEVNEGNGNGANPLYHLFIDSGRKLSPIGTMIHPARFLFNAGKTPKDWNEKILSDSHFKVVNYWAKSIDVFSNVDVKGGIAITMWNENVECDSIGFFSPYPEIRNILNKVLSSNFQSFSEIVYPRDLYKLTEKFYQENPWADGKQSQGHRFDIGSSIFDIFPEVFLDTAPNESQYIGIYGLLGRDRVTKWIKRDYVKLPDNIDQFKVFIPKSNGSGAIGEVLSTPIIGVPVIGHTLTFLSIGCFFKASYAEACLKYIKTRFVRLLLGTLKVTQDNPKDTWANVPMQDFTENSDIDWNKNIAEIDAQLCAKYNLSADEIAFIESMIKPME